MALAIGFPYNRNPNAPAENAGLFCDKRIKHESAF